MVQASAVKPKLLIIAGPTGVGKTKLAIDCYKLLNCELISADSMQIYKNCDIGTAKISKEEQTLFPHKNIDIVNFYDEYSVAEFKKTTLNHINEITNKGKLPILVGGTGLYIESLLFPYEFQNCQKNTQLREKYNSLYDSLGGQKLIDEIISKKPALAKDLHPNNRKRIIRALEIINNTEANVQNNCELHNFENSVFDYQIIFLSKERSNLYSIINKRVDEMLKNGLIQEAQMLYDYEKQNNCKLQVSSAIGYKELYPYFDKISALAECVEKIKQHSRNYAKRQITWYKRYTKNIEWRFNEMPEDYKNILISILRKYQKYLKNSTTNTPIGQPANNE